jgi:hypothetical protein
MTPCHDAQFVFEFLLSLIAAVRVFFRSRSDTALDVLALRQQVAVLKRKRPRPPLNSFDRLFLARYLGEIVAEVIPGKPGWPFSRTIAR